MASIALQPGELDLEFSYKESLSLPILVQYQAAGDPAPDPVPINLTGYTAKATVYNGQQIIGLDATITDAAAGIVTVSWPAGRIPAGLNSTWDLVLTDSGGNARQAVSGAFISRDNSAMSGFVWGPGYPQGAAPQGL